MVDRCANRWRKRARELGPLDVEGGEEVWQQRNDAIRSYNGLIEMGKTAKQLGVDTSSWKLPEEEKDKFKDYKFSIDHKVLESGKVQYAAKLTKRKNNDE